MPKPVSPEKKVIAITGKGGVGKTVLTAMMARILMESRNDLKVLLIDGDPAMGLPVALGLEVKRTIGEAREFHHSMALPAIMRHLGDLGPDAVLPYAPSFGRADLRAAWLEEVKAKNPSLADTPLSLPVVTVE